MLTLCSSLFAVKNTEILLLRERKKQEATKLITLATDTSTQIFIPHFIDSLKPYRQLFLKLKRKHLKLMRNVIIYGERLADCNLKYILSCLLSWNFRNAFTSQYSVPVIHFIPMASVAEFLIEMIAVATFLFKSFSLHSTINLCRPRQLY